MMGYGPFIENFYSQNLGLISIIGLLLAFFSFVLALIAFLKTKENSMKIARQKEMSQIVALLFENSRDDQKSMYFMKGSPGYLGSVYPKDKKYFEFWDQIRKNKHLTVEYLRNAIDEYLKNKSNDTKAIPDENYEIAEKHLIEKIEERYYELLK